MLSLHIMPEIVADCLLSTWKWWQHWGEQQEKTRRIWCLDCIIELLNQLPSKLKSFFSHYERNDTSLYSHPSVFSVGAYGLCKRWSIEMQKENNTIPINAYFLLKVVSHVLEKEMATQSSTLAWKIPWAEEPGRLQSWDREESDTTEPLHFHFSLLCIREGNGNPLQCSCLENPRDGGAWWAAVYGVAQSRTRLKQLNSSSSSYLQSK